MATYTELYDFRHKSELLNKISAAVAIQADVIRQETAQTANHANRLVWAKEAFKNPESKAQEMIWGILAVNKSATVQQITEATDATILSNVASLVDSFAL